MNLKNAFIAAASVLLAVMTPACSSDPNPVGYLDFDGSKKDAKTYVELDFSALGTRASASDEAAIAKVKLYIFDENDKLESVSDMKTVEDSKLIAETTPGQKTIYAISANDILGAQAATGMAMADFENLVFSSQLSDIRTAEGFVMVGKSAKTEIKESKSPVNLPDGNKLSVSMERLVAKVAVVARINVCAAVDGRAIDFKVFQTNDKMRLKHNGTDIASFKTANAGTFEGYSFDNGEDYVVGPTNGLTTAQIQYLPENIVLQPTSGNTTFVCIRMQCSGLPRYYMNGTDFLKTEYASNDTFYMLGLVKTDNPDVILEYEMFGGKALYFESEEAARYRIEYHKTTLYDVPDGYEYKPVKFEDGYMYYRINIAEGSGSEKKYRVVRNKFYKINIESINAYGAPTVEELCPADPNSALEEGESVSSAWGDATFTVVDWDSSNQTEKL